LDYSQTWAGLFKKVAAFESIRNITHATAFGGTLEEAVIALAHLPCFRVVKDEPALNATVSPRGFVAITFQ
jgi:hypothetical protein